MSKKKSELKYSYIFTIGILIIFSLALFIIGQKLQEGFWSGIVNSLASTLFISGIFSLLDQYILKEKLIGLILEKLQLKEHINRTGIEDVFLDINNIDYAYYIKKANKNLDIVHVYGRSWTTKYIDALKDRILNSNCKVRVVLVSPESPFVKGLSKQFDCTEDELKQRINNITKEWTYIYKQKDIQKRKKTTSTLEVYYHKNNPTKSLYRIDNKIICVDNKLIKGRTTKLPAFVFRDTQETEDLFNSYLEQINVLISESESINLKSI